MRYLLVTDRRALDLDRLRQVAAAHGWTVALERLDGSPAPVDDDSWFPEILRLVVTAPEGVAEPDERVLLASASGLALDERRTRPRPPERDD